MIYHLNYWWSSFIIDKDKLGWAVLRTYVSLTILISVIYHNFKAGDTQSESEMMRLVLEHRPLASQAKSLTITPLLLPITIKA